MHAHTKRIILSLWPWAFAAVLLTISALALAIGAAPRYLEELRIGGGYGDTDDGGADFEQDGDILTDGDLTTSGTVTANDLALTGNYTNVSDVTTWRGQHTTPGRSADALFRLDLSTTSSGSGGTFYGFLGYDNYASAGPAAGGMLQFNLTWHCDSTPTRTLNFSYYDVTSYKLAHIKVHEFETDKFEVQFVGPEWFYRYHLTCSYKSNVQPDFTVFGNEPATAGSNVSMTGGIFLPDDAMLKLGHSQDFQLRYQQDNSDHYFKVQDGSGNDMLTVLDKGTVGEVGVTGTLNVDGLLDYVNSGVVTLDGLNPTPVDFTDEGGIDMPDATYAVLISAETTGNPITVTWANRTTSSVDISAWNVDTGNPSTSSTLRVSWMVIDR